MPGGEDINDWFTIDTRNLTLRERAVVGKWQGSDYRYFTDYVVTCNRDVDKFAKFAYESESQGYLSVPTKKNAKWLAEEIAYDTPILDSVLGNQLKKSVTLWRVQEDHFMGDNPKVGDIITLPDFRSTAISKEGALWFNDTNSKPMNYILEIEAPKGTYGAYIAPLKEGDDFVKEMEFLLKEAKLEIMEFDDYRMQTALGNELTHIKIRIIE